MLSLPYYYGSIFMIWRDSGVFIPGLSGFLGGFECSSDGKSLTPVGNTDRRSSRSKTFTPPPTTNQLEHLQSENIRLCRLSCLPGHHDSCCNQQRSDTSLHSLQLGAIFTRAILCFRSSSPTWSQLYEGNTLLSSTASTASKKY